MIIGINSGAFGTAGAADVKACVGSARLSVTELSITTFQNHWNAGIKVVADYSPFNSGGVVAVNATATANAAVAWYQANTNVSKTPWVEIFNEPALGGSGWGSNASSAANARAYAKVLKAFALAFRAAYPNPAQRPLLLASWDGGASGNDANWGNNYWFSTDAAGGVTNVGQYVDGITMHSYSFTNSVTTSESRLKAGFDGTGKPVYCTETGWATAPVGSNVPAVSQATQAANITQLATWMSQQSWMALWTYFCYVDFSGNAWGVATTGGGGGHKPSYAALHNAYLNFDTGVTPPPPPAPTAPIVVTGTPAGASSSGATLTGTVNPGLLSTNPVFDEGPTTAYGNHITGSPNPIPAGGSPVNVSAALAGPLTPGQTRHVRVSATNSLGTTVGADKAYVVSTGAAPLQIKVALNPSDHSKIDISQIDPTVTQVRVAWTPLNDANNALISNYASPFPTSLASPDPTKPWGNASAYDGSGTQVGVWWDAAPGGGRVQTTPGAGATSVVIQLHPTDPSKVQVVSVPPGTLMLHVAEAQDTSDTGLTFPGSGTDPGSSGSGSTAPFTLPLNFTPPATLPAVKMLAYDAATYSAGVPSGNELGSFSPYVVTTPAPASPVPTVTTDDITGLTASAATYNGHADTHGVSSATYQFERQLITGGTASASTFLPGSPAALPNLASPLAWGAKQTAWVTGGTAVVVGTSGFTSGRFLLAAAVGKGVATTQANITPPSLATPWVPIPGGTLPFFSAPGGAFKLELFSRFAGASEVNGTWKFDQVGNHIVSVHAFDGVDPTRPLELQHSDTGAMVSFQTSPSGLTAGIPVTLATTGELKVYGVAFPNEDTATFPTTTPATFEREDANTSGGAGGVTLAVGTQQVSAGGFSPALTVTLDNSANNGNDIPAGFALILRPVAGATSQPASYADSGLSAGTYQNRLSVTAGGQTAVGAWVGFVIGGAAITAVAVTGITTTTATASAHIDPLGTSASWRARISTDGIGWTDLGADVSIGTTPTTVTQAISNLQPGRDYYVDFVVTQ